jgi:hypothetical protein
MNKKMIKICLPNYIYCKIIPSKFRSAQFKWYFNFKCNIFFSGALDQKVRNWTPNICKQHIHIHKSWDKKWYLDSLIENSLKFDDKLLALFKHVGDWTIEKSIRDSQRVYIVNFLGYQMPMKIFIELNI